ncbi:hypothetical protein ACWF82_06145 [Nocardia sp. NPDC055053]
MVATEAIFGFVGVALGSMSTSVLTIYKERFTSRRETAARDVQFERERLLARNTFQRESILALQVALADLINAADVELDRVLTIFEESGQWPSRQWETPTAVGWSDAVLRFEQANARVFDDQLQTLATEVRRAAYDSVWADSFESSKNNHTRLVPLQAEFQRHVAKALPSLY